MQRKSFWQRLVYKNQGKYAGEPGRRQDDNRSDVRTETEQTNQQKGEKHRFD